MGKISLRSLYFFDSSSFTRPSTKQLILKSHNAGFAWLDSKKWSMRIAQYFSLSTG